MRPRSTILACLGALVLLGGALLALLGGSTPAAPLDEAPAATTPADSAAALIAAAVADFQTAPAEDEGGGADDPDGDSEPRRVAIDEDDEVPTEGPLVVVLRGTPPQPAAGVEVAWVGREAGRARAATSAADDDLPDPDLPLRFGVRGRTDAAGQLRLPPLREETIVTAHVADEALFASRVARRNRDTIRLLLVTDEQVELAVVGPDEAPRAGIPVAIAQGAGWNQSTRTIWRGVTDQAGKAVARHFQLLRRAPDDHEATRSSSRVMVLDASSRRAAPAANDRFAASLALPLPHPVATEFEGAPAPTQPIILRAPATTPLLVTVAHRDGAPLLLPLQVRLYAGRDRDFTVDLPLDRGFDRLAVDKPLGAGPVEFPHVGVGTRLQPALRLAGERRPLMLPEIVTGPTPAAAPTTLMLPDELTVLALQAIAPDGQPLPDARLVQAIATPTGTLTRGFLTTLADGRADFVCRPQDDTADHVLTLRLTRPDGEVIGCERRLGPLRRGERRDLGALQLVRLPPLASGRVVDDTRTPIVGASVAVERLVAARRGERWDELRELRARSGEDGAFAIVGTLPPGVVRLRATAGDHFPTTSAPIGPGIELELRLDREGQLSGQVLLADWMPRGSITLQIGAAGDAERPHTEPVRRGDGRFRVDGLRPGPFRVSAFMRNVPEPLATVDGVMIAAGANTDRRLAPLDLSASLFRYELRAVGDGGQPLAALDDPILWRTTAPDGTVRHTAFRWEKGRAELLTPSPFLELVAMAQGFAPTELAIGPGSHDVYLRRLHPVIVDLPGVRGTAGLERAIRVSLIATGDTGVPQGIAGIDQRSGRAFGFPRWKLGKSGGGWLDGGDRAEVVLSRGGKHQVVLRLYADADQNGSQTSIEVGEVDVVLDGPGPQQHRLTVDLQEVQRRVELFAARAQEQAQQGARPGARRPR